MAKATPELYARNIAIMADRAAGLTYRQISRKYGITYARAYQIVNGIIRMPQGPRILPPYATPEVHRFLYGPVPH